MLRCLECLLRVSRVHIQETYAKVSRVHIQETYAKVSRVPIQETYAKVSRVPIQECLFSVHLGTRGKLARFQRALPHLSTSCKLRPICCAIFGSLSSTSAT